MTIQRILLALLLLSTLSRAEAQRTALPIRDLPPPNINRLLQEDRSHPTNRFAAPIRTDIRMGTDDQLQQQADGSWMLELPLRANGALALGVYLDQLELPLGGAISLRSNQGEMAGPYTRAHAGSRGRLLTDFLAGDAVVLTYRGPRPAAGQGLFRIWRVDYVYAAEPYGELQNARQRMSTGFGAGANCHENAACLTDPAWEAERRAVCRIIGVVEEGTVFCSGTLVNNTAQDGRPLLLTGFHCQDGFTPLYDLWRFYFNYQAGGCATPVNEPTAIRLQGAEMRAGWRNTDFLLLEVVDPAYLTYDLYYAGWDRTASALTGATMLHHPRGDIQKVAASSREVSVFDRSIQWNNDVVTPASHHLQMTFDRGSFELGSSGAALFDAAHHIRGQLNGGPVMEICDPSQPRTGFFGRLHLSWEGGGTPATRLRDWLDPAATQAVQLAGFDPEERLVTAAFTTTGGRPLPGARFIYVLGSRTDTLYSDARGEIALPAAPPNAPVLLAARYTAGTAVAGLSTFDLVLTSRHILGIRPLESVYQQAAADVNGSGTITTLDIVIMRRVLLGKLSDFAPRPNWIVVPRDAPLALAEFSEVDGITFLATTDEFWPPHFIAVKTGDVDDNAVLEGE